MTRRAALRLNFAKKVALAVAGITALVLPITVGIMNAPRLRAQSVAAGSPKFEVASIRPGCPGSEGTNGPPVSWIDRGIPGRLSFCFTLVNLIDSAYFHYAGGHVNPSMIRPPHIGDPSWFESEKYMLNAKADGNASQAMMRGPMLQALLEERFKLKVHWETRQVPVYELTAGKGGPKLQPFKEGSCIPPDFTQLSGAPKPGQLCRNGNARKGSNGIVDWRGLSLDQFAEWVLIGVVDRPVIDKTGIAGKFNFHLEFVPDQATRAFLPGGELDHGQVGPSDDPVGPTIFSAIQEQLGLKLVPAKGPREFLVIDHVERPSEN